MTDNVIAKRILERAQQLGYRRADLPRVTGVTKDRLDNLFKRPGAKLNAADLLSVASKLNTTEDYIMYGGEPPSESSALRSRIERHLANMTDSELRALEVGLERPRVATNPRGG